MSQGPANISNTEVIYDSTQKNSARVSPTQQLSIVNEDMLFLLGEILRVQKVMARRLALISGERLTNDDLGGF